MKLWSFILILILLSISNVYAVTSMCGRPHIVNNTFTGSYLFTNQDNHPIRVYIDNRFSLIRILPNNTFYLNPGESIVLSFRAYTELYDKLFVFVTDLRNNFTSSLECRYYALPEGGYIPVYTTTTTTTTIQQVNYNCDNKAFYNCIITPGCKWVGNMMSGYCRSVYENQSTTTTTTPTTYVTTQTYMTTTRPTTTSTTIVQTVTNNCQSLNFWQCQSNYNCKWIGDMRVGRCSQIQSMTTTPTTSTATTTTATTTPRPTTTTVCSTTCVRWLRLTCLEWKSICVF